MNFKFSYVFLLPIVLAGCPNVSPYTLEYHDFSQKVGSLTTDGSKRSLIIDKVTGKFCSEPSPDAIGTLAAHYAASLKGALTHPSKVGGSGEATGESDVKSGIFELFHRSQGVQLLRDGLYRLCEAHLNGAMSAEIYGYQLVILINTLNYVVPLELCVRISDQERIEFYKEPEEKNNKDVAEETNKKDKTDTSKGTPIVISKIQVTQKAKESSMGACFEKAIQFVNISSNASIGIFDAKAREAEANAQAMTAEAEAKAKAFLELQRQKIQSQ